MNATGHGRTPGAAQRSSRTLLFSRKPYFLLSWISLKAARARYPFSLASLYHLSRRPFPCFFWIAMIGSRAGEERGDFTGCGLGCQATAVFGAVGRPQRCTGLGMGPSREAQCDKLQDTYRELFFRPKWLSLIWVGVHWWLVRVRNPTSCTKVPRAMTGLRAKAVVALDQGQGPRSACLWRRMQPKMGRAGACWLAADWTEG